MKKIGVLLSGCGHLDGSEIREAVLTLLALDQYGAEALIMAPNIDQHHVVNHLTGEESNETRNVLVEASRIARGKIKALSEVKSSEIDALMIPGGFGAAKNLSNLAFEGAKGKLNQEVEEFLLAVHNEKKPIGAICIAPAVISLLFGRMGAEVTIGNDQGTADTIRSIGGKHSDCSASEVCVDSKLKIVSTPAYMYDDASLFKISQGINQCVKQVIDWL